VSPIESVNAQRASEANTFPLPTTLNVLLEARVVGIVGSRDYPEPARVPMLIALLHQDACVISGGAPGIDNLAQREAVKRGLAVVELEPKGASRDVWIKAAAKRNLWIPFIADVTVAFWDGASSGTRHAIEYALQQKGLCIVALPGQEAEVWIPKIR
jgi:hypothetical protein